MGLLRGMEMARDNILSELKEFRLMVGRKDLVPSKDKDKDQGGAQTKDKDKDIDSDIDSDIDKNSRLELLRNVIKVSCNHDSIVTDLIFNAFNGVENPESI